MLMEIHRGTLMESDWFLPGGMGLATLTLKNVPDELLEQLRTRARAERRSLNQEVIRLLEQILVAEERSKGLRVAAERQVEAWRRIAGSWRSRRTAAEEIRRIYSARTRGRDVKL
jgi:plasmid stability protein